MPIRKRARADQITGMGDTAGVRDPVVAALLQELQENMRTVAGKPPPEVQETPLLDIYDDTALRRRVDELERLLRFLEPATGGGGTSTQPAKVTGYASGPDEHTVSVYGNGFNTTATETGVVLDSIINLAANEELDVDRELIVLTAGEERIGLLNGIF